MLSSDLPFIRPDVTSSAGQTTAAACAEPRLLLLWSDACEERVGDLRSAVSHYTEITHTVIQEKIPPDEAASLTHRKHPERLLHAKSSSIQSAAY